jgi:hypothetical protein
VVADLRPGIYDDHCKPITPGALDDLFGVRRTGTGKAEPAPLAITVSLAGVGAGLRASPTGLRASPRVSLHAEQTRTDPFIQPTTAKALAQVGSAPAVLIHRVGQGQAVLLNFELPPRGEAGAGLRASPGGYTPETYQFLRALYALAGVGAGLRASPAVSMTAPDGGALPSVETRVWQSGEATIWGSWYEMDVRFFGEDATAKPEARRAAKITLPQSMYVYDLRAGRNLGKTNQVRTTFLVGRANFFAALPYPIGGVNLQASPASPQPGGSLTVKVSLRVPAHAKAVFAVHVEVFDPEGRTPWGDRVVLLPGGQGSVSVPIAWNDAPGRWRLRATELFSRASGEVSWSVKP